MGWQAIGVVVLLVAVAACSGLGLRGDQIEGGMPLCLAAVLVASLLAWEFATGDLNLYFDRWYLVDRLLVVVLAGLVA